MGLCMFAFTYILPFLFAYILSSLLIFILVSLLFVDVKLELTDTLLVLGGKSKLVTRLPILSLG